MNSSNTADFQIKVFTDILDEEFQQFLELTYSIMKTLKKPSDREICGNIIKRCSALDAQNIEVKICRNEFYKYFLRVLQATACTQPTIYDKWFQSKNKEYHKEKQSKFWSNDERSYVAAKAIPGVGTLVYLAVSYKPELGWQNSGFNSYDF